MNCHRELPVVARCLIVAIGALCATVPSSGDSARAQFIQRLANPHVAPPEQPTEQPPGKEPQRRMFKMPAKRSFGGLQIWTDHLIWHGYRMQQHAWTGHWRLLSPKNHVLVSGTRASCQAHFDRLSEPLGPIDSPVVITVHGLGRTRRSMRKLGEHLQSAGFYWVDFGYASTRADVDDHAQALQEVVYGLVRLQSRSAGQADRALVIHFVGHSLGNIVVRRFWKLQETPKGPTKKTWQPGHVVMLAPPNQGSSLARTFQSVPAFPSIAGKSSNQLSVDWDQLKNKLATPPVPFGVIAGGRGNRRGYNPWLDGDDDMIVTVAETRLAGAADFRVVPAIHTYLMDQPEVCAMTLEFLKSGWFQSADKRRPISDLPGEDERPKD